MVNMKDLDNLEELLIEEIHKVVKTGEIKDATQVKAVKDVVEALKYISCIKDGSMGDNGYSGYNMPNPTPYNQREVSNYSSRGYNRQPRMGRYMDGGYSGHSIHDRMIASLEQLYDEAKTQHEQSEIGNWINKLRSE